MRNNVGTVDAVIRFLIGLAIAFYGLYHNAWWGLLGLLPILSGALHWCPIYQLIRFSTAKNPNHNRIRRNETAS